MGVIILILSTLFAIYFANVISCAIICETYEDANLAKPYVYMMPFLIARLFFFFLTEDFEPGIPRLQLIILYLMLPAKNIIIAECIAELCKEQNRQVAFKPKKQRRLNPNLDFLAACFGTRIENQLYPG